MELTLKFLVSLFFLCEVYGASTIYVNSTAPDAVNNPSCWTNPPCSTLDLGLQGIHNVLATDSDVTLIIAEGRYNLSESLYTTFENVSGISIIGSPSNYPPTTIVDCVDSVGFGFFYSSDIVIHGIEFSNCNQLRNSTSFTGNAKVLKFITFYVSFYLLYCTDVSIQNASISNNNGTGLVVYNPAGTIVIEESTFSENYFLNSPNMSSNISGGGGVNIEFSYCVPHGGVEGIDCLNYSSSNVDPGFTSNANISIRKCLFYRNRATITGLANNTFILPHKQFHAAFGRGGGLSLFFKGKARNNKVSVDGCTFWRNNAVWGAGIFAEFQDNTANNTVSITNSCFYHNKLEYNEIENTGTGGGGARVGYIFFGSATQYGNSITFDGCTFIANKALYGGGISFYSSRQIYNMALLNVFTVRNSSFDRNKARLGAALDMSLWHPSITGVYPSITISDSNFTNNTVFHPVSGVMGLGAVFVDSLPVVFDGTIKFILNNGSALVVSENYAVFSNSCKAIFDRNRGRNGAAIALFGSGFIYTYYRSSLQFYNNTAEYRGGAIFQSNTGERDLLSSRNCFIRYYDISVRPSDWTAFFYFNGNTANGYINAIHTSALLPCLWGGGYGSSSTDETTVREVFCWNRSHWKYYNSTGQIDTDCSTYITTNPARYSLHKSEYDIFPGQSVNLNFSAYDDMNNTITESTIFLGRVMDHDKASFHGFKYTYIAHGYLNVNGSNSNVTVQLETEDPIVIQNNVTVMFKPCPPAFTLNTEEGRCYCSGKFKSYVKCDNASFSSQTIRGAWLGDIIKSDTNTTWTTTVVGISPYVSGVSGNAYVDLPSDENASEFFCDRSNREGILCGKCKSDYGVAMNSPDFKCVKCREDQPKYSWAYYLLSEFFLLTIFCLVIFVFGITVTMGPLNAYIFFAQIITTTINVNSDGTIPLDTMTQSWGMPYSTLKTLYVIPYDVWNMNFLRELLPEFCLSRDIDTVAVYALGYVTALYPLLLLTVFVSIVHAYSRGVRAVVCILRPLHNCVSRMRQVGNLRQTVTGGVAAFIVISYTKFSFVSLSLLTPIPLYNASGHVERYVYYPDGTIEFGDRKSCPYIVLAAIILATFVAIPPLLLIWPSTLKFIERVSCRRIRLTRLYPPTKLQAFLDEFHGCYRDGSDGGVDCRWFAGFYFLLRLVIFVIYSATDYWRLQYVMQLLCFLATALLFAVFRPYHEPWLNTLDIGMFLLLVAITGLSQYNLLLTWIGLFTNEDGGWSFMLQYLLILMPLCYFLIYYGRWFVADVKNRCVTLVLRKIKRKNEVEVYDDQQPGLINSMHVPEFLDYVEGTGRLHQGARGRTRLSNPTTWRRLPGNLSNSNSSQSTGASSEERTPLLTANGSSADQEASPKAGGLVSSSYHTPSPSYGSAKKE